jgi:hypothetical protein
VAVFFPLSLTRVHYIIQDGGHPGTQISSFNIYTFYPSLRCHTFSSSSGFFFVHGRVVEEGKSRHVRGRIYLEKEGMK